MARKKQKHKFKHFGVLCSTLDIANQFDIWKGIVDVAVENNIHLTAYICTFQTTDNNFHSYLESCFDTMFGREEHIDGLIMLSGFIAQNVGIEEFEKYVAKIPKGVPTISISYEMPGIHSVTTDNEGGVYSAVEHLIRVHGKKQIAFIKGPDGHPEAEARLAGYRKALEANGLPFDENYLFPGDFGREHARRAVAELYDVRKIPVDAFACCNDQSAIGVLQRLKDRDIMVPNDVAVVGFDNDIVSSLYVPAIATAGQDFKQLGQVSARLLIDLVNGAEVDEVTQIVPEFIPRQSCGCLGKEEKHADSAGDIDIEVKDFSSFAKRKSVELLQSYVPREQIVVWVDTLLDKIHTKPFNRDEFLVTLDKILVTFYHSYSTEFAAWHKTITTLAMGLEFYKHEFEYVCTILSTLTYSTTLIFDIRMSEQKKREHTIDEELIWRKRNTDDLLLMFDEDALAEEFYRTVTTLHIYTAFVAVYHNPVKRGSSDGDRSIKTLIGFDSGDRFKLHFSALESKKLSDYTAIKGFNYDKNRRTLIYQPLFFMDEELGVLLLAYDDNLHKENSRVLRTNISSALKGAQLMSTIRALSVTDELTGLLNRRGFFQFAYNRLSHLNRSEETIPLVMFLDMDALKHINDNFGHNEGDNAIKIYAEILKKSMREEDIIGRIGGDEFVVLSSIKSKENAACLEQRIRDAYRDFNALGYYPYKIDGSIGSMVLEEATHECLDHAMLSADSLLYEEKKAKKKLGLSRN